jgi:hypothetical protein
MGRLHPSVVRVIVMVMVLVMVRMMMMMHTNAIDDKD